MNQGKSDAESEGSAIIAFTCFVGIAIMLLIAWLVGGR